MRHVRWSVAGAALVFVAAMAGVAHAQPVVESPPAPGARILWDHDGVGVDRFEVRADGATVAVQADLRRNGEGSFDIALPTLVPGRRVSVVVAACNPGGCAESEPLEVEVVAGPIRWEGLRLMTGAAGNGSVLPLCGTAGTSGHGGGANPRIAVTPTKLGPRRFAGVVERGCH